MAKAVSITLDPKGGCDQTLPNHSWYGHNGYAVVGLKNALNVEVPSSGHTVGVGCCITEEEALSLVEDNKIEVIVL